MLFKILLCFLAFHIYRQIRWARCKPDFTGKTVFISGGSSGLGEELCKQMIRFGAKKVIIAARRLEELRRVQSECQDPSRVVVAQIDLNKPREVLVTLTALCNEHKVDILVNNGGISMRDEFKDLDFSVCETMLNTNLLSQIAATKAALPGMTERKTGAIINVSSGSGIVGLPVRTMYSSSKFGLSGFGKALRSEVKRDGIHVLQVYPGYVQTNISSNAIIGDGSQFGKVDSNIKSGMPCAEAALQIIKALCLKRTEFIVGGLMVQLLPYVAQVEPLINFLSDKKYKSQLKVKAKAE